MKYDIFQMSDGDLVANANLVKEIIFNQLAKDGHLTKDVAENLNAEYAIIVVKKGWLGWLGRTIDKLFSWTDKDETRLVMVKIV